MRHLQNINENFGGERSYKDHLDSDRIDITNPPKHWSNPTPEKNKISWRLQIKDTTRGVEMLTIIVDKVWLDINYMDDSSTTSVELEDVNVHKDNISDSIYPSAISIDMNGSGNSEDWETNIRFGKQL